MLVLTRYRAQAITIGDDIKIRVLGVFRGQVRIGIDAPKNIPVHREEIKQKIDESKNGGNA